MGNSIISILTLSLTSVLSSQPAVDSSYHLDQLQIERAWEITKGDPDVKVAILSTGLNYELFEIPRSSLALNEGEIGKGFEFNGVDDDHNGYVDDVFGADIVGGTGDPMDSETGLGTYTASLLVSPSFGLAPDVQIIPVKVFDEDGMGTVRTTLEGFDYALQRGADIIHYPGGWSNAEGQVLCDKVKEAGRAGVLVVAPALNEPRELDGIDYLAACDAQNLVIATSTTPNGDLAPRAGYSSRLVDVAVPGVEVRGLDAMGYDVSKSGNAIAASLATAVAALVASHRRNASVQELKEALIRGVDYDERLVGKVASRGRLNAFKALVTQ